MKFILIPTMAQVLIKMYFIAIEGRGSVEATDDVQQITAVELSYVKICEVTSRFFTGLISELHHCSGRHHRHFKCMRSIERAGYRFVNKRHSTSSGSVQT